MWISCCHSDIVKPVLWQHVQLLVKKCFVDRNKNLKNFKGHLGTSLFFRNVQKMGIYWVYTLDHCNNVAGEFVNAFIASIFLGKETFCLGQKRWPWMKKKKMAEHSFKSISVSFTVHVSIVFILPPIRTTLTHTSLLIFSSWKSQRQPWGPWRWRWHFISVKRPTLTCLPFFFCTTWIEWGWILHILWMQLFYFGVKKNRWFRVQMVKKAHKNHHCPSSEECYIQHHSNASKVKGFLTG